jgi:hypothetical protein
MERERRVLAMPQKSETPILHSSDEQIFSLYGPAPKRVTNIREYHSLRARAARCKSALEEKVKPYAASAKRFGIHCLNNPKVSIYTGAAIFAGAGIGGTLMYQTLDREHVMYWAASAAGIGAIAYVGHRLVKLVTASSEQTYEKRNEKI